MKTLFTILDYIVAVLMGTCTLCFVSIIVNEGWNMFFAMVAGMIMGMVVLTVIVLIFGPICSIFQLLPSGMIITKLTGMATGMMFAMADVNFAMVFFVIVIFSLFVQFVIDLYNMKLKGDVIVDE